MQQNPSPLTPRWRGAVNALIYLGVYFLSQALAAVLFVCAALYRLLPTAPGLTKDELLSGLVAALTDNAIPLSLCSNLITLLALFLVIRLKKQRVQDAVSLTPVPFDRLWPLLPLGMALNGFVTTALSLLPTDVLSAYTEAASPLLSETGLSALLALAFLGPVTEELVFRGLLFQNLSKSVPALLAALLTSALFGALHGQPVWMGYAFCMGLIFCLAFRRYRSLWASLLLHMSFNLSGGIAAALALLPLPWALAVSLAAVLLFLYLAYQKSRPSAAE